MHVTFVKRLGLHFLDLVFPIVCIECRKEGQHLCKQCQVKLKRNEFQICAGCGSPSPFGLTHPICKPACGLDGLISAVPYKEPLARKLVEFCKYRFISGISEVLAEMIAVEVSNLELENYFEDFVIVPLPLHPTKKRWRGFNQAELIADQVSAFTGIAMRKDLLARRIRTRAQAELKDEERKLNVQNAFQTLSELNGMKIIILDDVSTTRSTLTEACKSLKSAGASEIWGLVFAQG
jgi:ComF family protein